MSDDTAVQDDVQIEEEVSETSEDTISKSKKEQGSGPGLEIKAQASVAKLLRAKESLKDIKNALKAYKVTSEKLEELKKLEREVQGDEHPVFEIEFQSERPAKRYVVIPQWLYEHLTEGE